RIVGRLVDEKADRPVEAATLVLDGGSRSAVTDADGRFTLDSVPGGTHHLRVEHVGYGPRELELRVPPGRTADVRIGLAPRAVRMPPIDVEVRLRPKSLVEAGFYERRRIGRKVRAGHFILGEELRRRAVDLSSALSTVPGLRSSGPVEIQGQLVTDLLYFPRYDEERFGTCLPAIYLDAHKVVGSGSPPRARRRLGPGGVSSLASVAAVSGVEIYDSPAS
ncbi:MAG: carboxypeptidase-like regulatory domain-containing protein, partial [Gemmatimonadota bacterium]